MVIRPITSDDAENFLSMLLRLDAQTKFMLFEVGERPTEVIRTKALIQRMIQTKSFLCVAENTETGEFVGYISAEKGSCRRMRFSACVVIGILASYYGRGIGTEMMYELDKWARKVKLRRLEITVVKENSRAVDMFKKCGFEIEGIRRSSLCIDGKMYDEYYMAKVLQL